MKAYVILWLYLPDFSLWRGMDQIEVVEKIRTNFIFFLSLQKSCLLWDNVDRHAWQCNTAHLFACWLTTAKNTNSQYVISVAFPHQQWLNKRTSALRSHVLCLSHMDPFFFHSYDVTCPSYSSNLSIIRDIRIFVKIIQFVIPFGHHCPFSCIGPCILIDILFPNSCSMCSAFCVRIQVTSP
jgi:hypothetical protein